MATLQVTKKLHISPLIDIQSATFAEWYKTGVRWRLFGWCEHGGVLTLDGTLRPDAKTLVLIHTQDFREGYERGRWDYFTQGEFSGRLFPLAKPQLSIHPELFAKQGTVLQEV